MEQNTPKLLRRAEAAAYLRERYGFGAPSTLNTLAATGRGPKFIKRGGWPLYSIPDLEEWVASRTKAIDPAARSKKSGGGDV